MSLSLSMSLTMSMCMTPYSMMFGIDFRWKSGQATMLLHAIA